MRRRTSRLFHLWLEHLDELAGVPPHRLSPSPSRTCAPTTASHGRSTVVILGTGPVHVDKLLQQKANAVPRGAEGLRRITQAKLTVGGADDPAEREADNIADLVLSIARSTGPTNSGGGRIRRRASSETAPDAVRRRAPVGREGGELDPETERALQSARSGGTALDAGLQRHFGEATGADVSGVRLHTGEQATSLNDQMGAVAFTVGHDIFFRDGVPDTGSDAGLGLVAHEVAHTVQQGASPVARRRTTSELVQRYTDIPDRATWKADSAIARARRSTELKVVDDAVERYDAIRGSTDTGAKRQAMMDITGWIKEWEKKKKPEGVAKSERKDAIAELKQIVEAKVRENLDAHAIELTPLVGEYTQAASDASKARTRKYGQELYDAHHELFPATAANLLKTKDREEWATVFFNAPENAVGAHPFTSLTIKAITDFSWLTREWADIAVNDFLLPYSQITPQQAHVMQMLQHTPFRKAILAKATPKVAADLTAKMPLVRMAEAAQTDAATKAIAPSIEQIADSVFSAFLGDQPVSGLRYATNSADFKAGDFLLGNSPQAKRAPCMVLSNMLTEVFKAVLPSNNPASAINPMHNNDPLLTKPLASIGAGNGILTGEASFSGNVDRFGDVKGYATVNRIFFGDGHEWLQVGHREYDPTLGITGPVGTVAAQVEGVKFARAGDKFQGDNGMVATRSKKKPPGGAPLLFQRTVTIK